MACPSGKHVGLDRCRNYRAAGNPACSEDCPGMPVRKIQIDLRAVVYEKISADAKNRGISVEDSIECLLEWAATGEYVIVKREAVQTTKEEGK